MQRKTPILERIAKRVEIFSRMTTDMDTAKNNGDEDGDSDILSNHESELSKDDASIFDGSDCGSTSTTFTEYSEEEEATSQERIYTTEDFMVALEYVKKMRPSIIYYSID